MAVFCVFWGMANAWLGRGASATKKTLDDSRVMVEHCHPREDEDP